MSNAQAAVAKQADPINLQALEAVFRTQAEDDAVKDETVAELARAIVHEASRGKGEDRRHEITISVALGLLKSFPKEAGRLKTQRYLWNRLLEAWGKTNDPKAEEKAALFLIERPSLFGLSPEVKEWEEAVKAGTRSCFDLNKLARLLAQGADGNRALFERAFHRYLELTHGSSMRVFLAGCIGSIGLHTSLAGPMVLSHIQETTAMLDEIRDGSLSMHIYGHPSRQKEEVLSSRHFRLTWYAAFVSHEQDSGRQRTTKWLAETAAKLRAWKQKAPEKRDFKIALVVAFLPYSYGWEHHVDELAPVGTIKEMV